MNKFLTGMLTGGILAAVGVTGLTLAVADGKTKHRLARDGKRALSKANHMLDDIF